MARRLYRQQGVGGGSGRDAGAVWDDFVHGWPAVGVLPRLEQAHGAAL
jgi:hypothetical protein